MKIPHEMDALKKNIFLFSLAAALLTPAFSMAEITPQPTQSPSPGGILNNLPQPLTDFIKSAENLGIAAGNQFQNYVSSPALQNPINTGITQLKGINIGSIPNNIYQFVVKIIQLVGGFSIWILSIVIDFIKQGLSLLH